MKGLIAPYDESSLVRLKRNKTLFATKTGGSVETGTLILFLRTEKNKNGWTSLVFSIDGKRRLYCGTRTPLSKMFEYIGEV